MYYAKNHIKISLKGFTSLSRRKNWTNALILKKIGYWNDKRTYTQPRGLLYDFNGWKERKN